MSEQKFAVGDRVKHVGIWVAGTVLKIVETKNGVKVKVKMDKPPIDGTRSTIVWYPAYALKKEIEE